MESVLFLKMTFLATSNSYGKVLGSREGIKIFFGTEKDVIELQNTFSWLNFEIMVKHNVEAKIYYKLLNLTQKCLLIALCVYHMGFGIEVTFADFCLYIAETPGNKALS